MSELKTTENDASVDDFLNGVADTTRREDAIRLLEVFHKATGQKPRMWGTSIVGYGKYHYKSERSRQEGDWPLTGFSPRKQNLTIYIMQGFGDFAPLLAKLGKHKISGGSCIYINKLADVDMDVLEQIVAKGYAGMKKLHGV